MMDKLARDFYHIREKRKKSVSHKAAIRVLAPFTHTLTRKQHELFMSREMASREINENLINLIMANKPTMAGRPPAASLAETWMPSTVQQTATVLKNYTNSSGAVIYLTDLNRGEIYQIPNKVLSPRHLVSFKIEPGKTVSAYVAYSKKIVYTSDLLGNHNFPLGLGWKDSTRKAALVVPILTPENRVAIVIELTKDVEGSSYSWTDALAALSIGSWIGAAVHHRQQISIVNRKHQICTYLHEIITQSALLAVPLHMIISQIMNFAKYSIGADKTSFVLLENGNNETFMVMYNECSDSNQHCREEKIQFSEDGDSVPARVLRTGTVMNVVEKMSDTTTSVLAVPVTTDKNVGVLMLINKKDNKASFTHDDEQLLLLFAEFTSFAALQCNAVAEAYSKDTLSLIVDDTLQFQFAPCGYEINCITEAAIDHNSLSSFKWELQNEDEAPQTCVHLLKYWLKGLMPNEKSLYEFIIAVKKNCAPFSNLDFFRSFMALHTLSVILHENKILFKEDECISLVLVAFCHRITGGEYNELHLLKLLLQTYTVMKDYSTEDFKDIITEIGLLMQFGNSFHSASCRMELTHILAEGQINWGSLYHRYLIKMAILTVSSLSYRIKPCSQKMHIGNYYKKATQEFEASGVLESVDLEVDNYNFIAQNEAEYLEATCIPWISILNMLLPNTKELIISARQMQERWEALKSFKDSLWRVDESYKPLSR